MTIEYFFDLHSPYAYLASTQLEALEEELGLEIAWRPFLLGGVFKAAGNRMPAEVPAKARWMLADLQRWARQYQIPLNFPNWFPGNSLMPMRVAVAAFRLGQNEGRRFAQAAFHAAWTDDVDLSVPEASIEVANLAGLDGVGLIEAARTDAVKSLLRESTDEAVARGAFGAPSFFVKNAAGEHLIWGNDRFDQIRKLVR